MSDSALFRKVMKRAPSAPSITRWSYDRDSGSCRRGWNSLPFQTGLISDLDTPRIPNTYSPYYGLNAYCNIYTNPAGKVLRTKIVAEAEGGGAATIANEEEDL